MNLVSIVIPIYNMERYLHRALDCLIAQTYKNWEAILVDDGSTDHSGSIANEYAKKDPRFRVIHKENGGRSDARNAGMKVILGEWLLFLDPDDFFHPQLMDLCLQAAIRDSADLVAFTYDRTYRTKNLIGHTLGLPDFPANFKTYSSPKYMVTDNLFLYATEHSRPKDIPRRWAVKHCQIWRCMYRTEMVRDIPFIKGICYEDFPWWSAVLLRTSRCTILNLPLYFYYPNPKSYIFSANTSHKADSLRQGIEAGRKLYATAPEEKRLAWERNFLTPFIQKLKKKET